MNTLVFDIETVPDVALGRRLYDLEGLADAQVAKAMFALRRQDTGGEFLPLEQHRVVAISCLLRSADGLRVWSLGDHDSPEGELVQRFFDGIEKFSPDLVSWNGSGFDLPVLHLPRPARRGAGAALLGDRRPGPGVPLQQLPEPLPLAAHRPDGRAVRLPAPRPRVAEEHGAAARPARQARLRRQPGVGRLAGGRYRRHPQLLRDRRAQYLSHLSALRAAARRADARAACRGAGARARLPDRGQGWRTSPRSCAPGRPPLDARAGRRGARTRRRPHPRGGGRGAWRQDRVRRRRAARGARALPPHPPPPPAR